MSITEASAQPATVFDEGQLQLSRVYSQAILSAAQKSDVVAQVVSELEGIATLFQTQRHLLTGLTIGVKNTAETDALILKAFQGNVHELVLNLLRVLNEKGRLNLIHALVHRVVRDSDRVLGRCRVKVQAAQALTEAQTETLSRQLQARLGMVPVIEFSVVPSLIGGLVIRVGDLQFDSSIRSRLEQLRKNLLEGKIHEIQSRRDQLHTSA
jgi:F-type H+-transporting ATPase subunit delta